MSSRFSESSAIRKFTNQRVRNNVGRGPVGLQRVLLGIGSTLCKAGIEFKATES